MRKLPSESVVTLCRIPLVVSIATTKLWRTCTLLLRDMNGTLGSEGGDEPEADIKPATTGVPVASRAYDYCGVATNPCYAEVASK